MKNPRILLVLALVAALITLPGCTVYFSGFDETPTVTPENTTAAPINPTWTPPDTTPRTIALPSFADVVEKVYPSVVAINTETVMLDFFSQKQTQKGAGSGWVLDNKDNHIYVVTNNHVVEGAKKVIIAAFNGKSFEVDQSQVKRDSFSDLAVIEVPSASIQPAVIGDSAKLRVGDWVLALGNPLGQGIKAKEGTVSGLNVSLAFDKGQLSDLIETSAPINPGNSGGPLVNLNGEVVGITSAKIADIGVEGLGYAISIKTAMPIISQLITRGYIARPYLGVATRTNSQEIAMFNRLSTSKGAIITQIDSSGPAAAAGLKLYDVITKFNGKEISSSEDLLQLQYASEIGQSVEITYIRKQETRTVTVKLVENKPN
jgi:serine protease Do